MTHKNIIVFTLFLIFNLSCFVGFSSEIIPNPDSRIFKTGDFFLSKETKINYSDNFKISAEFLKDYVVIFPSVFCARIRATPPPATIPSSTAALVA